MGTGWRSVSWRKRLLDRNAVTTTCMHASLHGERPYEASAAGAGGGGGAVGAAERRRRWCGGGAGDADGAVDGDHVGEAPSVSCM